MHALYLTSLLAGTVVVAAAASCPVIELDWGSYTGTNSDNPDICVYENVRFASPPVGKFRFAKPQYPPNSSDPPAPTYPVGCVVPTNLSCRAVPPGGGPVPVPPPPPPPPPPPTPSQPLKALASPTAPECDRKTCLPTPQTRPQEDCLFLDVYVPLSALQATDDEDDTEEEPLPVIVWFYGGGFITGSKHPFNTPPIEFYPGTSIISSTKEKAIWVAGNYRLGAYGWLAGSYMEANAQPNAGLHDQRAVLKFVRDHISKFAGDASRVSVWGESAGASSILHHITMPENIMDPLFQTAVLQSPAFQWAWNRTSTLNQSFTTFAKFVAESSGCELADIACVRGASSDVLLAANNELLSQFSCTGILPIGPSVDNKTVLDLPTNQLRAGAGNFMNLSSLVVSHVDLEVPSSYDASAISFIPTPIRADPYNIIPFNNFLETFFTGNEEIIEKVKTKYPSNAEEDQVVRAAQLIMDSSFLCNTRILIDAFSSNIPVYAMDYAVGSFENFATHGTDLVPLFAPPSGNYTALFKCLTCGLAPDWFAERVSRRMTGEIGPGMQSYFMGAALHNDPMSLAVGKAAKRKWSRATVQQCTESSDMCVANVMKPVLWLGSSFYNNATVDSQTSTGVCDFWAGIASDLKANSGSNVHGKEQAGLDVNLEL